MKITAPFYECLKSGCYRSIGIVSSLCFLLFILGSVFPLAVYAQVAKPAQGGVAASPDRLPTSSLDVFPALPPSTFCKKEDLIGIWKLIMIYEVPSGKEIALYTQKPLQYFVFEADSRYGEYTSILRGIALKEVRDSVIKNQRNVQQFSLNKSGMLFFYKDSIAVDSLACFIVAKASAPFDKGQLLLMPSEKIAKGRMVKVYQKMFIELEIPPSVVFKIDDEQERKLNGTQMEDVEGGR